MSVTAEPQGYDHVLAEVRAAMARRKVAGQRVAELIGISQSAWSRRMSGVTPFTAPEILAIAEALHVQPAALMPTFAERVTDGCLTSSFALAA